MQSPLPLLAFAAVAATSSNGRGFCHGFLAPWPGGTRSSETGSRRQFRAARDSGSSADESVGAGEARSSEPPPAPWTPNERVRGRDATAGAPLTVGPMGVAKIEDGDTKTLEASTKLNELLLELEAAKDLPAVRTIDDPKRWTADFDDEASSAPGDDSTLAEKTTASIKLAAILGGGTYLFAAAFGDLLTRFELVQEWRYVWPLVGFLYMADGARALLSPDGEGVLGEWWGSRGGGGNDDNGGRPNRAARIVQIAGGIFTVVGGAYDAFMPVWMTGPNVVTSAGIGQDGAALLFLWTAWHVHQNLRLQCGAAPPEIGRRTDAVDVFASNLRDGPLLSQVILLAQLYTLGEGSFDELIF